jgi:hypothetical protein
MSQKNPNGKTALDIIQCRLVKTKKYNDDNICDWIKMVKLIKTLSLSSPMETLYAFLMETKKF